MPPAATDPVRSVEGVTLLREGETTALAWARFLRGAGAEILHNEIALAGDHGGILIQGHADCLLRLPDGRVLIVDHKRSSSGGRGLAADIMTDALGDLDRMYGNRAADGDALTVALRRAAQSLLGQFPESLGPKATSDSARRKFERNHRLLRDAAFSDAPERDWKLWEGLRKLRLSKRPPPTPEGYDSLAEGVMQAAEGLLRHPGPLHDARTLVTALVTGAQQVLPAYDAAKRSGGLIDYADMTVETETLLRTHPQVLAAVLTEIDCVVIDEFQDTNPVQFALLWRLARGAARALIVGDAKQSIMGFQGPMPG